MGEFLSSLKECLEKETLFSMHWLAESQYEGKIVFPNGFTSSKHKFSKFKNSVNLKIQ